MMVLRHPKRSAALVLVAVLWVIVILTVIVTVTAQSVRLDARMGLAAGERLKGKWLCRAGLERALALLNDDSQTHDILFGRATNDRDQDSNEMTLPGGFLAFGLVDEAGKLNVNTASREQLLALPEMTENLADALLDWRDPDNEVRPGGAERGYYQNLPVGYEIRNGPFRTIGELLAVKGFTPELLYGENADSKDRFDDDQTNGNFLFRAGADNERLNGGLVQWLTCCSYDVNLDRNHNPRININQADETTLTTELKLPKSHAKWIVENRKKQEYKSIADLINNDSPKEPDAQAQNSDQARPLDLKTFTEIADRITVSTAREIPGLVNVNTASQVVLQALLEDNEQLAQNIISYRRNLPLGMRGIAEVLSVPGMKIDVFKKIAPCITTSSRVFGVACRAVTALTQAVSRSLDVVDRNQDPVAVLYHYQGATY